MLPFDRILSGRPTRSRGERTAMELDSAHILTVFATIVIVLACVIVHYEGLVVIGRWVAHDPFSPRTRIALIILGQLVLHVCEIWIFAVGYFVMANTVDFGALVPSTAPMGFGDYVYYSAVCYTTLGFGELVPVGPIRFLTGMEAVLGLTQITWSASFTFLKMQKYWDS